MPYYSSDWDNLRHNINSTTHVCRIAASEGNQTLRALCCAAHAACILVRDLVLSGNVCEVWPHRPAWSQSGQHAS